jgi:glycosyltransferase involved in cell wall biosynthesis
MRICFIYDCEYPWDIRVEKICNTLINAGHDVSLLCRNKNSQLRQSIIGKLKVFRLPHLGKNVITKILNITIFFNPIWLYSAYRVVSSQKSEVIIVRDLPLALTGIIVGKLKKIPVIVDMAEPYPLTVKQRRNHEPFKIYHLLTRNFFLAEIIENIVISYIHHIYVVCEEARDRLVKKGLDEKKVSIVRNTPVLEKFSPMEPIFPGVMSNIKGKFILLYVGIIIGGRGIDTAISAMKIISEQNPDVKLVIVGNGKLEMIMRNAVVKANLGDSVFFEGWVDHNEIPKYVASCSVGLLPANNTEHANHTIQNKFFDFMSMKKPVISSDVRPMKRMIEETKAGLLFKADDPSSLANTILEILKDDIEMYSSRGLNCVRNAYNWSTDAQVLLSVLQRTKF